MKKRPTSKKNNKSNIYNIIKDEALKPLRYDSKKDIDFVSAAINYFKWHFSDDKSITGSNITDWWRQRVVCVRNKDIKNEDEEGWFPDILRKKCFIETYFIEGETNEEWLERKKNLHQLYSTAIGAYQEAIFANTIKRISPEFKSEITKHYLKNGTQKKK